MPLSCKDTHTQTQFVECPDDCIIFFLNWLLFLALEELKGPCCGPMGDFHCHSCSPSVLTKVQLSDCCSKYTECPYRHLPQLSSAVLFLGYDPTWTYSRAENWKKFWMAILVYKYFSSEFVKRDQSNKMCILGVLCLIHGLHFLHISTIESGVS